MSDMSAALALLKADLGFFGSALEPSMEEYLNSLLKYAETDLADNCGIDLITDDPADAQLLAMDAAWLYRKRVDGPDRPPMLKLAIRNRQVTQALQSARTNGEDYI